MNYMKRVQLLLLCAVLLSALVGCSQAQETVLEPSTTQEVEITTSVATEEEDIAQETVEVAVEETVEEAVEATVEETVEAAVEEEIQVEIVEVAQEVVVESEEMLDIDLSVVPLAAEPAVSTILMPVASGTVVYANTKAAIDASNTADGYVMIRSVESTTAKLKVIVSGPSGTAYYYNLTNDGSYEVFPLSDGSGTYQIQVCKNVTGTSYAVSQSATVSVSLADEFAPFLLPNQYVNYTSNSNVVSVAAQLVAGKTTEVEKIQAVYNYVVSNLTYDSARAASVTSGYLPDLDSVLAEKKGICFDYAALMTAMLRSQGIPCKLVVGYAGTSYHAWINAYSTTDGWMDSVIYFDGTTWKLMDPTFASSANSSASIMAYIGDGTNYTEKYLY
ncbi:transglutaminase-like domain-containing protein [Bengtsoniella intestinalis]|uniref:transglutaminase-like domain-containing protein n=1 Tax=Bengtsoniella intestinalis TaxID=3073143 RepID=UPI00391F541E